MDDEIWTYYRKEATKWAVKRDQSFRSSQNAYKRGDGLKAKMDSNLGKNYKKLADEANKSAAEAIFIQNNENRPSTVIDLHGLYVNEAIDILEEYVIFGINNCFHQLDVIVGQGNHSDDGPKLKPNVMLFAENNGIPYTINERNPGCIHLRLGRSDVRSTTTERGHKKLLHVGGSIFRSENEGYQMKKKTVMESSSSVPETTNFSYIFLGCILFLLLWWFIFS